MIDVAAIINIFVPQESPDIMLTLHLALSTVKFIVVFFTNRKLKNILIFNVIFKFYYRKFSLFH